MALTLLHAAGLSIVALDDVLRETWHDSTLAEEADVATGLRSAWPT